MSSLAIHFRSGCNSVYGMLFLSLWVMLACNATDFAVDDCFDSHGINADVRQKIVSEMLKKFSAKKKRLSNASSPTSTSNDSIKLNRGWNSISSGLSRLQSSVSFRQLTTLSNSSSQRILTGSMSSLHEDIPFEDTSAELYLCRASSGDGRPSKTPVSRTTSRVEIIPGTDNGPMYNTGLRRSVTHQVSSGKNRSGGIALSSPAIRPTASPSTSVLLKRPSFNFLHSSLSPVATRQNFARSSIGDPIKGQNELTQSGQGGGSFSGKLDYITQQQPPGSCRISIPDFLNHSNKSLWSLNLNLPVSTSYSSMSSINILTILQSCLEFAHGFYERRQVI
jgi:hypothetical protein